MVADLFWSISHLEFDVEVIGSGCRPTLDSVSELWKFLWERIQNYRRKRSHPIILPRLRSLDVLLDESSRLEADLSERDDEARRGMANVKCVELEALRSKLASEGAIWNCEQSKIMNAITERATTGQSVDLSSTKGTEMMRPPAFRDMLDEYRFRHPVRWPGMMR